MLSHLPVRLARALPGFRRADFVLLAGLLLVPAALAQDSAESELPPSFESRRPVDHYPVWVSQDELSPPGTPRDAVDWSLVGEPAKKAIEFYFEADDRMRAMQDPSPCLLIQHYEDHFEPNNNLVELTASSLAIYRGKVAGRAVGFYLGHAGTLLRVEVQRELKGDGELASAREVYVHYPYGEFEVGGRKFCLSDRRYPQPPRDGDAVLLFVLREPLDARRRLIVPEPTEIVFESGKGELSYTQELSTDLDFLISKSLDDLEWIIEEELAPSRDERSR